MNDIFAKAFLQPSAIAAAAASLAATATLVAVLIAFLKYRSDRASQRFTNAVHLYRRYLELAFEYPKFAEPDLYPIDMNSQREDFSKYEWFVGLLLRACEELLEHRHGSVEKWNYTILSQLRFHKTYFLNNQWFQDAGVLNYSPSLRKLIKMIAAER